MGNGYNGEEKLGQEKSSGSSSNNGKKSSKSNKAKIPQRGMGIAELEKLRLGNQSGSNFLPYPQAPFNTQINQEHLSIQEANSSPPIPYASAYCGLGYYQSLLMGMEDPDYYQSLMMEMKDPERGNIIYGDSQFSTTASWIPGNGMLENRQFAESGMTGDGMGLPVEGANKKRKVVTNDPVGGSSSQNSGTIDAQEIDLELKLSLDAQEVDLELKLSL